MAIEIEKRGVLRKEEFEKLMNTLKNRGTFKGHYKRLFIDYTPFIEKDSIDVRVRVTNNVPEIIIKKGKWFDTVREEVSVILREEQLSNALKLMGLLGYKKGILGIRKIWRFDFDTVEFSLTEIVRIRKSGARYDAIEGYSYFFEIEGNSEEDIDRSIKEFGLEVMTTEEWTEYVMKDLNKNANVVFDVETSDLDSISEVYESV